MDIKIIGIDPGIHRVGWAVIVCKKKPIFIDGGVIITKSSQEMSARLLKIHSDLSDVISAYNPIYMAIEKSFVNNNKNSSLKFENARGAIMLTFAMKAIGITEYGATYVKKFINGYGHSDKISILNFLKKICVIEENKFIDKTMDISDAISIAVCCYFEKYLEINQNI